MIYPTKAKTILFQGKFTLRFYLSGFWEEVENVKIVQTCAAFGSGELKYLFWVDGLTNVTTSANSECFLWVF